MADSDDEVDLNSVLRESSPIEDLNSVLYETRAPSITSVATASGHEYEEPVEDLNAILHASPPSSPRLKRKGGHLTSPTKYQRAVAEEEPQQEEAGEEPQVETHPDQVDMSASEEDQPPEDPAAEPEEEPQESGREMVIDEAKSWEALRAVITHGFTHSYSGIGPFLDRLCETLDRHFPAIPWAGIFGYQRLEDVIAFLVEAAGDKARRALYNKDKKKKMGKDYFKTHAEGWVKELIQMDSLFAHHGVKAFLTTITWPLEADAEKKYGPEVVALLQSPDFTWHEDTLICWLHDLMKALGSVPHCIQGHLLLAIFLWAVQELSEANNEADLELLDKAMRAVWSPNSLGTSADFLINAFDTTVVAAEMPITDREDVHFWFLTCMAEGLSSHNTKANLLMHLYPLYSQAWAKLHPGILLAKAEPACIEEVGHVFDAFNTLEALQIVKNTMSQQ